MLARLGLPGPAGLYCRSRHRQPGPPPLSRVADHGWPSDRHRLLPERPSWDVRSATNRSKRLIQDGVPSGAGGGFARREGGRGAGTRPGRPGGGARGPGVPALDGPAPASFPGWRDDHCRRKSCGVRALGAIVSRPIRHPLGRETNRRPGHPLPGGTRRQPATAKPQRVRPNGLHCAGDTRTRSARCHPHRPTLEPGPHCQTAKGAVPSLVTGCRRRRGRAACTGSSCPGGCGSGSRRRGPGPAAAALGPDRAARMGCPPASAPWSCRPPCPA
jgi:hypothetical protein